MKLNIKKRDLTWKKVKLLRKKWLVPGVVYWKHINQSIPVVCDKNEFLKVYNEAWESTPLDISWDWINELALIYSIQKHTVTDMLLSIDFLAVNADEEVETEIPVILVWDSLIEKNNEWRIEIVRSFINVRALPRDLPHDIKIDRSTIKSSTDVIFIKDINLWDKIKIKDDLELPIVTVVELYDESSEAEESKSDAITPDKTESTNTTSNTWK